LTKIFAIDRPVEASSRHIVIRGVEEVISNKEWRGMSVDGAICRAQSNRSPCLEMRYVFQRIKVADTKIKILAAKLSEWIDDRWLIGERTEYAEVVGECIRGLRLKP
jgi:hypothetical protein